MGAVYRALDSRLNIPVALKEMTHQPGLDQRLLVQLRHQFQREATILAQLSHPNLVNVSDFFEEGGNAYLVMSLVEGDSLAARIRQQGALPEAAVLTWADQLLGALAYCHRRGVLHRDIKPQNIIIRGDGQAVLVDFGLVKLWDPNDPRTQTAMQGMGTPQYAPPEQYGADPSHHTDPRTDVYSVGATLYHALTARMPPTVTERMADPHTFVVPRRLNAQLTPQTEAVVLRAMELPRDSRFRSAEEMAAALRGRAPVPAPMPGGSRPSQQRQPAVPRVQRSAAPSAVPQAQKGSSGWLWALAGLAGVIVVGIVVALGLVFGPRLVASRTPAPPTQVPESTAKPTTEPGGSAAAPVAPSLQPGNTHVEYIVDGSSGMAAPLGGEGGSRLLLAQQALVRHWQALGPAVHVGLRAYGHRTAATDSATCQDVELLAAVQAGRLELLVSRLQTVQARGLDSLAEALRQTVADFEYGPERVNAVVLVSDGGDTCGGGPLAVVEAQRETGISLPIYVVGLEVEPGQREELVAIAQASGGRYYDAADATELDQALVDIGRVLSEREQRLAN
jgi:serine/threonine-protein kinase